MFIQEVVDHVNADGTVTGLVSGRVYTGPVLPRGYVLPAAIMHVVTATTDYTFGGPSPLNTVNVQLDVYGSTQAEVEAIQRAIKAVLETYKGTLNAGSVVTATVWESDGEMPFTADVNKTGLGYRNMSKLCFFYMG